MNRLLKLSAFLLLLSPCWLLLEDAFAQPVEERFGTVTVVGEATAEAPPDLATVRFGVVTRDDDPEEARRRNADAARRAMNEVRSLIPDERKMRLESLRLQPVREYDPERRRQVDLGFEAVRDVVVEVDDLDVLPRLVARIVQEGANRLNSVTYELDDQEAVRNEAIQRALANARQKADLMATSLGTSLGRVLRISEHADGMPRPMMYDQMAVSYARAESADAEPEAFAPGEIEVRMRIEVVFALATGAGQ